MLPAGPTAHKLRALRVDINSVIRRPRPAGPAPRARRVAGYGVFLKLPGRVALATLLVWRQRPRFWVPRPNRLAQPLSGTGNWERGNVSSPSGLLGTGTGGTSAARPARWERGTPGGPSGPPGTGDRGNVSGPSGPLGTKNARRPVRPAGDRGNVSGPSGPPGTGEGTAQPPAPNQSCHRHPAQPYSSGSRFGP